jgi:hypothetical protein
VVQPALPEPPDSRKPFELSAMLALRGRAALLWLLLLLWQRKGLAQPGVAAAGLAGERPPGAPFDQLARRPSKCSPAKAAECGEEEEREAEMGVRYS